MVVFRGRQEPLGQRFWKFEKSNFRSFQILDKNFKNLKNFEVAKKINYFQYLKKFKIFKNFQLFKKKNEIIKNFKKALYFKIFKQLFFYLNNSVVFNIKKSIKLDHNFLWIKSTRMLSFSIGSISLMALCFCITIIKKAQHYSPDSKITNSTFVIKYYYKLLNFNIHSLFMYL